ncbi:DUF4426 domain-containing protein [Ramlibacter sp.]|uniref:DUF4426 domain-containing protein n=1 Tax=Ramlibacter sp. TaxID=1917967 RepID=UPI003FA7A810
MTTITAGAAPRRAAAAPRNAGGWLRCSGRDRDALSICAERSALRPVPARVDAGLVPLGRAATIEMREVREDGRISYVGTYDFLPREVIDFRITATPLDARLGPALSLAYRDRMWRP